MLSIQFIVYSTVALLVAFIPMIIGRIFFQKNHTQQTTEPYECGFSPIGDTKMPIFVSFYIFAILFVLFDLEMAFLFPWAMILKKHFSKDLLITGWLFLAILCAGLYYEWKQGVFKCLSFRLMVRQGMLLQDSKTSLHGQDRSQCGQ